MLADVVKGYVAATMESATRSGSALRVAEELAQFSWTVRDHDDLGAALADPQLPPSARMGIIADLLDDKVAPETAATLRFAMRVTPAAEVARTLAELAAFSASVRSATVSGRVRERMRGYAERVFEELTDPAALDTVEDDLFALARSIEGSPGLRDAFGAADPEARVAVARDLLGDRIAPATLRVVLELLAIGRIRDLPGTLDWLVGEVALERGRRVATVRSAVALDPDEHDRLAASLSALTGRTVEVRVVEDPAVVGGVLVAVGEFMIDATVRLRLERLADALRATA
jgi:F-type H+-transporting ATPase subunit delta